VLFPVCVKYHGLFADLYLITCVVSIDFRRVYLIEVRRKPEFFQRCTVQIAQVFFRTLSGVVV
jgi:hypothetical protein